MPVIVDTWSNEKKVLISPSIDESDGSHAEIDSTLKNDLPTLLYFIEAQPKVTYCNQVRQYIGLPNTALIYDENGILVRKAPIDCAIQKVMLTTLHTRISNLSHYSLLPRHPGERRMYHLLRREVYWRHLVSNVFTVVNYLRECIRMDTKFNCHKNVEL